MLRALCKVGRFWLIDSALHNYFLDGSFGVKPGGILRTEHPSPAVPVVIYRDTRRTGPAELTASGGCTAFT